MPPGRGVALTVSLVVYPLLQVPPTALRVAETVLGRHVVGLLRLLPAVGPT